MPLRGFGRKGGGFGGGALASQMPEVAPGEQEIKSVVTITYEFR